MKIWILFYVVLVSLTSTRSNSFTRVSRRCQIMKTLLVKYAMHFPCVFSATKQSIFLCCVFSFSCLFILLCSVPISLCVVAVQIILVHWSILHEGSTKWGKRIREANWHFIEHLERIFYTIHAQLSIYVYDVTVTTHCLL